LLPFVPVIFDAYRLLKPRMWPVMQALVAHADRAGRCWPSVRRIADLTGVSHALRFRAIWRPWNEPGICPASAGRAVFMPTRSPRNGCRRPCPIIAIGLSRQREQKNRQVRKQGTRKRDSQNLD
jgi:hypothetical protein